MFRLDKTTLYQSFRNGGSEIAATDDGYFLIHIVTPGLVCQKIAHPRLTFNDGPSASGPVVHYNLVETPNNTSPWQDSSSHNPPPLLPGNRKAPGIPQHGAYAY